MTKRVGMVGAMALTMVTVSGVGAQGVQEALRAAQELQAVEAVVQAELAVAMPRVQAALAESQAGMHRVQAALAVNQAAEPQVRVALTQARASMPLARVALAQSDVALAPRGTRSAGGVLAELDVVAPPAWLQQDPGDSLYRAGREALNDRDYRWAARMFRELIEEHPESGYASDAYYYQAFALYRAGRVDDLNESLILLETLMDEYPEASTVDEAERLMVRVEGQMARRGDVESTRRLMDQASGSCEGQDYEVRAMALSALINMDSDRAMPILREVLQNRDECPELRAQAVFLVSQHGGPEVVDLMLDLAHRNPDPDPEVRSQAVFWLSQVDSPEAVDALESILRGSEDMEVQEQALFALSQHDSDRAMAILREFAERSDAPEELRGNAIFWLSQNSDLGADYLIGLWGTVESRELREQIIFGMSQIGDRQAADWLMEQVRNPDLDMELRTNALFWAAQTDDVDVDGLLDLYETMPETEMREQILFGLSQIDNEESVDALMTIARSDDDPELRENAIFWLGQSDDPRVADFLLELIRR